MKTIEQVAKEYANLRVPVYVADTEIIYTVEDLNMLAQCDFEAGAKFAQRWIPVEEELPEEGVLVQAKYEKRLIDTQVKRGYTYATCRTNKFTGELCLVDDSFKGGIISHWRPIEYPLRTL